MDADYLKLNIGDILVDGLTATVLANPPDKVEFLSNWLFKYVETKKKNIKVTALFLPVCGDSFLPPCQRPLSPRLFSRLPLYCLSLASTSAVIKVILSCLLFMFCTIGGPREGEAAECRRHSLLNKSITGCYQKSRRNKEGPGEFRDWVTRSMFQNCSTESQELSCHLFLLELILFFCQGTLVVE